MLVPLMPKDASITVCHMTILHYQFTHGINVLWHNGCFWTTFKEFVVERASVTIEFIKPVFHSAIGWYFIVIQRFKFINALLS